ncbi:MAG: NCS2 family permease [Geodermatophilaceae bacterium]|nr:NCS2 family permease [Geodermatophilaceae bacterium]MDQ3463249.1 NCS2 family permease [Actinomycetota bacterium]
MTLPNQPGKARTAGATSASVPPAPRNGIDRYFEISHRGSTVAREVRGGLVTFMTMAYIVVLNPIIIGTTPDADGLVLGIPAVAAVTALVAAVMTILMGVVGKYPFALATGLGINALVAFGIASQMSWADAMGLVVLEGLVITLLVLTGLRTAIMHAIPQELKAAIGVGIGLFLAFIGLVDAGFARRSDAGPVPVQLGYGGLLRGWPLLIFCLGLLLMGVLVAKKVRGAILIGIVVTTVVAIVVEAIAKIGPAVTDADGVVTSFGWQLNTPTVPGDVVRIPDLSLLGNFSLFGGFDRVAVVTALLLVFTLLLTDFFDTMGTVVAVGAEGNLLDKNGQLPGIQRVLLVDSLAAAAGGAASASSNTTYIESAAGVGDGARTGLASVVTGALFVVALFFTPLVEVVPFEAATAALVIVGALMITQIRQIDLSDFSIALPAFLTIVVMPFTFSIANGIGAGFIAWVVLRAAAGRARDIHPLLWVTAALFVVYFAIDPLSTLLGAG